MLCVVYGLCACVYKSCFSQILHKDYDGRRGWLGWLARSKWVAMHRLHSSVWLHFPICYCRSVGLCVDEKPQCRMFHKNMNTNTHTRTHRPVDQFPENSYLQFPFTGTLSRERRYRERICISIPYIRSEVSGFGYINDCNLVRRMPAKRTEMIVVNPQGRPIQLE